MESEALTLITESALKRADQERRRANLEMARDYLLDIRELVADKMKKKAPLYEALRLATVAADTEACRRIRAELAAIRDEIEQLHETGRQICALGDNFNGMMFGGQK